MHKIKVLIIDDSPLIREILTDILSKDKNILVVGAAEDPYEGRDLIKKLKPDVITLDIEMPKMDGVSFLKNLMKLNPLPVIMISTLTKKGADVTIQALELGAVDFVSKPTVNQKDELAQLAEEIISKVKSAFHFKHKIKNKTADFDKQKTSVSKVADSKLDSTIVVIGASTGGIEAITEILKDLNKNFPPIVIVQHIPPVFSKSFALRLNTLIEQDVVEISHGVQVKPGTVYIAPGDRHVKLKSFSKNEVQCCLSPENAEKVSGHKPSVDVLFSSINKDLNKNIIAVILTGMGSDGAEGLKYIKDQGFHTIGQNEASCVVYGMPGAAKKIGAVTEELHLKKIANKLIEVINTGRRP